MTPKNTVLSTAAFIIGAALLIGTPVYAAEKITLTDPTIAALWKQIEVLQKQIAELQEVQKQVAKTAEPVVTTAVVATSTATLSATTTPTSIYMEKKSGCGGVIVKDGKAVRATFADLHVGCFFGWSSR
jgi:hypothetical protein